MKIEVTLEPNQEWDKQTFTLDELGMTKEEWDVLSEDDRETKLYDFVMDNICGIITAIEEV